MKRDKDKEEWKAYYISRRHCHCDEDARARAMRNEKTTNL